MSPRLNPLSVSPWPPAAQKCGGWINARAWLGRLRNAIDVHAPAQKSEVSPQGAARTRAGDLCRRRLYCASELRIGAASRIAIGLPDSRIAARIHVQPGYEYHCAL